MPARTRLSRRLEFDRSGGVTAGCRQARVSPAKVAPCGASRETGSWAESGFKTATKIRKRRMYPMQWSSLNAVSYDTGRTQGSTGDVHSYPVRRNRKQAILRAIAPRGLAPQAVDHHVEHNRVEYQADVECRYLISAGHGNALAP